jgi:hypothetical protein
MKDRQRIAFALGTLGLVLAYLAVETRYILHIPFGVDEFAGAYILRMFRGAVPYRDFTPPKTVLGFYLQLPVFAAVADPWRAMLAVKFEHAILAASVMFGAALLLGRRLPAAPVLGALAMLMTLSPFLEQGAELRVDSTAAAFGFISLLALIERRPALAGIFAAGAFLCTQKGVYFVLASQAGLLADLARARTPRARSAWLRFTVSSGATLAAYLACWSVVASPGTVLRGIFLDKNIVQIATTNIYSIRGLFWFQTAARNPLFCALAATGLILLFRRWLAPKEDDPLAILAPYILALSLLAAWHKQPWPYFIAMIAPPFFMVIAVALAELWQWRRATILFAIVGAAIPLARLGVTLQRDSAYQRATFNTAQALLAPNETYLDGTNMIYTRDQAAPEFVWLDWVHMEALRGTPPAQLMPLIGRIDAARPKLMLLTYRTAALPPTLLMYAHTQFAPLWGNILYYAPVIAQPAFDLHFDGTYLAEGPARIDDIAVTGGTRLTLRRGRHTLTAAQPVRLRLLPPPTVPLDWHFSGGGELLQNGFN